MKNFANYILIIAFVSTGLQSCKTHYFRSNYKEANKLLHESNNLKTKPFLKAHLKNGHVCILEEKWEIDTTTNVVSGWGKDYDFNRKLVFHGNINIHIDSVAIFETNKKLINPEEGRITALTILALFDISIGVACITAPKACFGSCPTFYINENDDFHYSDAEGFSNAISPSLEYFDIDAINQKFIADQAFSITMKNEALETHCVKDVALMAYPLDSGKRVYQSPKNNFFLCENEYRISEAKTLEGDVTALLGNNDRQEWFSLADDNNLSSKEEIFLTFENVKSLHDLGLILNFRQSLMTTYFIYSAIGYMGDEVSDIFAKIETRGDTYEKIDDGLKKELGNIDIYMWNAQENQWVLQGGFYETGPIAINRQIIPLENLGGDTPQVQIKIVLNKGLWRIDYVALTNILEEVTPIKLVPSSVIKKGVPDGIAISELNNPDKYLISMPGDAYQISFTLPYENTNYELFLYSKGYYLEWMRESWIADKNLWKLKQLFDNPKKYLRNEARNYKQYEAEMEQIFWNSKIDTNTFSLHEN
jgi:hypothetical protein